jgi:hypothetical protein
MIRIRVERKMRFHFICPLAAAATILVCGAWSVVSAAERTEELARGAARLKLITLNCQFLPGLAACANKRGGADQVPYRAQTLGRLLAEGGYSMIVLNEVFDRRARRELCDHLQKAFEVLTPPDAERSPYGIDSGLMLAVSRSLPILAHKTCVYGNDSDPLVYGLKGDGFARKGVLYARVGYSGGKQPGHFLEVFVTHLESHVAQIREQQWRKLAAFVKESVDPKHPVLICGDLNTDGGPAAQRDPKSPYRRMMEAFGKRQSGCALVDVWPRLSKEPGGTNDQTSKDGGRRIDYILLANPRAGLSKLRPLTVRVNRFLDPRVISLSDHSAVEAEMEWGE